MDGLRSAAFMDRANRGFVEILNLDLDAATRCFTALAGEYPDHPAPPLYLAMAIWLGELDGRQELILDRFVHPGYFTAPPNLAMQASSRKAFFDLVEKSRALAEQRLKARPGDRDAEYWRGAGEGLLAAFAITVDRSSLQAVHHGELAYGIERHLIEKAGSYYDAYILIGIYEYAATHLPWYLEWLRAIGVFRGDTERAIQLLNSAVEKGQYVSDEARVFRMVLLVREGRAREALEDAGTLLARYPRNYIFRLTQAQVLERMDRREAAADTYFEILRFAEEGRPNYGRIDASALRWQVGNMLLATRPQAALDAYEVLLRDSATPERWRVLAMLQSGCALDLLGRRQDAVRHYQAVLSMKSYDNAHAHASEHLESPFTATPGSVSLPRLLSK
jgi:tetratricopeptide (TPR) repeat protein